MKHGCGLKAVEITVFFFLSVKCQGPHQHFSLQNLEIFFSNLNKLYCCRLTKVTTTSEIRIVLFVFLRPPLPESSMEKMKRFKRRLSQTLRGSHTIDESLSELAEQMTIEENGLKDSGEFLKPF